MYLSSRSSRHLAGRSSRSPLLRIWQRVAKNHWYLSSGKADEESKVSSAWPGQLRQSPASDKLTAFMTAASRIHWHKVKSLLQEALLPRCFPRQPLCRPIPAGLSKRPSWLLHQSMRTEVLERRMSNCCPINPWPRPGLFFSYEDKFQVQHLYTGHLIASLASMHRKSSRVPTCSA